MQRKWLLSGAMLLVIIGSFLPWESAFGVSVSGVKGDGVITLILGIVGMIFWWVPWPGSRTSRGSRIAWVFVEAFIGLLIALIAGYHMGDDFAAIGVYLTFLAGVAWVITLFLPAHWFASVKEV